MINEGKDKSVPLLEVISEVEIVNEQKSLIDSFSNSEYNTTSLESSFYFRPICKI